VSLVKTLKGKGSSGGDPRTKNRFRELPPLDTPPPPVSWHQWHDDGGGGGQTWRWADLAVGMH
jgi:hypothetical protein